MLYPTDISIHALREEGDQDRYVPQVNPPRISIHALREEGDGCCGELSVDVNISIHALREEGDLRWPTECSYQLDFYPRPPRGGRLHEDHRGDCVQLISIHALREEGDSPASPWMR